MESIIISVFRCKKDLYLWELNANFFTDHSILLINVLAVKSVTMLV